MKTSLALLLVGLTAGQVSAVTPVTTNDLNLNCQGELKVANVGYVQHYTDYKTGRGPNPIVIKYSLADVQWEITGASVGCANAQLQFQLPFAVVSGTTIFGKVSQFGHVSQDQLLEKIPVSSVSPFQIQQTFYSANESGELPVFPLYHGEKIELVVESFVHQNSISIDLGKPESPKFSGYYFSNYKFLDPGPYYGVPSPKDLTADEKLAHVYQIMKLAKASNLEDDETLKIVAEALSAFQPSSYYDFKDKDPAFQIAIKKHLNVVIKFLNAYTEDVAVLKTSNDHIQSIFQSLQSTINFSLLPPFSSSIEDQEFVANAFVAAPLILQAQTGTLFDLTAEMIEKFLVKAKMALSSVSAGKSAQIKASVSYLKQHTPSYLITAKSGKLIEEILN